MSNETPRTMNCLRADPCLGASVESTGNDAGKVSSGHASASERACGSDTGTALHVHKNQPYKRTIKVLGYCAKVECSCHDSHSYRSVPCAPFATASAPQVPRGAQKQKQAVGSVNNIWTHHELTRHYAVTHVTFNRILSPYIFFFWNEKILNMAPSDQLPVPAEDRTGFQN